MHQNFEPGRRIALVLYAALVAPLAACAVGPEPLSSTSAGLNCVDDSAHCVGERQSALRQLVADKEHKWVHEPATPQAYASGVRLFAYKQTKRELSCEDLHHGRKEADGAPAALKSAGTALTPQQISRGTLLAGEVSRELANELKKRCKRG
jgi:hypothetical protein